MIVGVATALRAAVRHPRSRSTRSEFAPARVRRFVGLRARRAQRDAVDRDRHLRLRPARHRRTSRAPSPAAVALAIIMLPLVARSTQEVLALVPGSLREASFALGVSRWRTVLGVILPASLGGILTGATLAVARAAGETAPLLFTCVADDEHSVSWDPHQPLQSIPLDDLPVPRVARPGRPRAGVGGGARADDLRPRRRACSRSCSLARSRRKLSR